MTMDNKTRFRSLLLVSAIACLAFTAHAQDVDLPNRKDPLDGITTAGQPTAAQFEAAAASGFATVIDLRGPNENRGFDERATVEGAGMSYISLPVEGADGINYENAGALDKLLREIDGPVLIHCSSGNRAGALLALRAKLNGADDESALAVGIAGGVTALQPTVEQRLAEHD
jgi:uncharacterized protein (TIGR01244 family)